MLTRRCIDAVVVSKAKIETLAYGSGSIAPPATLRLRDNVIVRVAAGFQGFGSLKTGCRGCRQVGGIVGGRLAAAKVPELFYNPPVVS